jgi:hypothetical protein
MLSAAGKGFDIGKAISALPRSAHENAAQGALSAVAQASAKDMMSRIKAIDANKEMSPEAKTAAKQQIMLGGGYGYAPSGGSIDPIGNALKSLQMNLDLKGRAGVVGGGTGVTTTDGNPPAPPRQPATNGDANSTAVVAPPQQNEAVTGAARPAATAAQPNMPTDASGDPDPDWLYMAGGGLVRGPGQLGYAQPPAATFLRGPRQLGYAQPPPATFLRRR